MGWRCRVCDETHTDDFEVCWECGADRRGQPAAPDPVELEHEEPELSAEELAAERAALKARAAEIAYDDGFTGDPVFGSRLEMLVKIARGWKAYRARTATVRWGQQYISPDPLLDRLWTLVLWAGGAALGLFAALLIAPGRVMRTWGMAWAYALIATMVIALLMGSYTATRELRLARRRPPAA